MENDINRDPEIVAKQLTSRARQHFIRVSKNATDGKIPRPKNFRNFSAKDNAVV